MLQVNDGVEQWNTRVMHPSDQEQTSSQRVDIQDLKEKAACSWMTNEILMWNQKMLDADKKYEETLRMELSNGWPPINSAELKLMAESHRKKVEALVRNAQLSTIQKKATEVNSAMSSMRPPRVPEESDREGDRRREDDRGYRRRRSRDPERDSWRSERGRRGDASWRSERDGRDDISWRSGDREDDLEAKMKVILLEQLVEKQVTDPR